MTKEQLATLLNGREYRNEITELEEKQAKDDGLVVVFGASDDLMEFRGGINDEIGCYDGGIALIDEHGVLSDRESIDDDDELEEFFKRKPNTKKIEAVWGGDISWAYKTSIPHATFDIMEDGEVYCRGIVFGISDLDKEGAKAPKRDRDKSKRPSPSVSATLHDAGYEMIGNDGNMYVIAVASNGIHRWQKKK